MNYGAARSWRSDACCWSNALVVYLGQILANVETAIAHRPEFAEIVVLGNQIDEVAIGGNAHTIIITLREVENGARMEAGGIGDIRNGNAVDEFDVGSQSEGPGQDDVLEEPAEVGV